MTWQRTILIARSLANLFEPRLSLCRVCGAKRKLSSGSLRGACQRAVVFFAGMLPDLLPPPFCMQFPETRWFVATRRGCGGRALACCVPVRCVVGEVSSVWYFPRGVEPSVVLEALRRHVGAFVVSLTPFRDMFPPLACCDPKTGRLACRSRPVSSLQPQPQRDCALQKANVRGTRFQISAGLCRPGIAGGIRFSTAAEMRDSLPSIWRDESSGRRP